MTVYGNASREWTQLSKAEQDFFIFRDIFDGNAQMFADAIPVYNEIRPQIEAFSQNTLPPLKDSFNQSSTANDSLQIEVHNNDFLPAFTEQDVHSSSSTDASSSSSGFSTKNNGIQSKTSSLLSPVAPQNSSKQSDVQKTSRVSKKILKQKKDTRKSKSVKSRKITEVPPNQKKNTSKKVKAVACEALRKISFSSDQREFIKETVTEILSRGEKPHWNRLANEHNNSVPNRTGKHWRDLWERQLKDLEKGPFTKEEDAKIKKMVKDEAYFTETGCGLSFTKMARELNRPDHLVRYHIITRLQLIEDKKMKKK